MSIVAHPSIRRTSPLPCLSTPGFLPTWGAFIRTWEALEREHDLATVTVEEAAPLFILFDRLRAMGVPFDPAFVESMEAVRQTADFEDELDAADYEIDPLDVLEDDDSQSEQDGYDTEDTPLPRHRPNPYERAQSMLAEALSTLPMDFATAGGWTL